MKYEIKKLLLRSNTLILIYGIVLLFIGTLIYGTSRMKSASSLGSYLGTYNTQEELVRLADENLASFNENKETYEELGWDLEPLYERIKMFDYAVANHLTQKSAVLFSESMPFETRDSVGMMLTVDMIVLICMLVFSCCLSVTLVTTDFSGKQSRFLYSLNRRSDILKDKMKAFLLSVCAVFLILQLMGLVFERIFSTQISTVLFLVNGDVRGISALTAGLYEDFGGLAELLPVVLAFFAFALITRREETALILDIVFFLIIFTFCSDLGSETGNAVLASMGTTPFYQVAYGFATFPDWMTAFAAELGFSAVLLAAGVIVFRKARIR